MPMEIVRFQVDALSECIAVTCSRQWYQTCTFTNSDNDKLEISERESAWQHGNRHNSYSLYTTLFSNVKQTMQVYCRVSWPQGCEPFSTESTIINKQASEDLCCIWSDNNNEACTKSNKNGKNMINSLKSCWFKLPVGADLFSDTVDEKQCELCTVAWGMWLWI